MDWTTRTFDNAAITAFRDDVLPLLSPQEQTEVGWFFKPRQGIPSGSSTSYAVAWVLLGHSRPQTLCIVRTEVVKLFIKHGLQIRELIDDMNHTWTGPDWARLYLEYAEIRPELFREVRRDFIYKDLRTPDLDPLETDVWIRLTRTFPASVFWLDGMSEKGVMVVLENMPESCRIPQVDAVASCKATLWRRRLMALIVGVSDGFVRHPDRYFAIAAALPLELQEWLVRVTQAVDAASRPMDDIHSQLLAHSLRVLRPAPIWLEECDCRWIFFEPTIPS